MAMLGSRARTAVWGSEDGGRRGEMLGPMLM